MHVVDRIQAPLALIATRAREQCNEVVVAGFLHLRLGDPRAEREDPGFDLFEERLVRLDGLGVFRALEYTVDEMHRLARSRRRAERRGAPEAQLDAAIRQADVHLGARSRNPRVGRFFAREEVLDDGATLDRSGLDSPALEPRHLRRHRVVLDQPLRVGTAAGLQAQRVGRQRDVRFHVVVRTLRAVRHHQRQALAECHQHGQYRFVQRADLVGLDQRRVDQAPVRGVLDGRIVRGHQIVTDDQQPVALVLGQPLPALVVLLGEAVLDGQYGYLELANGAVVQLEDAVAIEHHLAFVTPEEVHPDRVGNSEMLAIGDFEFGHGRVQRDHDVFPGPVAALLDGQLHHDPEAHLGQRVLGRVDVGSEPPLEPDAHHAASLRALDDLLEAVLQRDGHLLGVEVVPGAEDQEHRLLHADVRLGILLLGVAPAHAAVAELPRGPHGAQIPVDDFLHSPLDEPLLRLRGLRQPPRARGERGGGLERLAFALAELAILPAIGQQEIQARDDSDAEEQPPGVDRGHLGGPQADGEQYECQRQRRPRHVAAEAGPGGGDGEVVRSVGVVVQALLLDSRCAAPRRQQEELGEIEDALNAPAS